MDQQNNLQDETQYRTNKKSVIIILAIMFLMFAAMVYAFFNM